MYKLLFLGLLVGQCCLAQELLIPKGNSICDRFLCPEGFERTMEDPTSFASYLRNLPLKEDGALVKYYDGGLKQNSQVYSAVVDLPIGTKDLHQCADAVMRLWAEYNWKQERYDRIHFNFTNGMKVDYNEWRSGKRMVVDGNKTFWRNSGNYSDTYTSFWKYMELIFMYAGTSSLEKELLAVEMEDMRVGDVFIQGGFPGHAIIVVDMAIDSEGEKLYMLAQSYMPAQEIQVLVNQESPAYSPWYKLDGREVISTPEWTFYSSDLKRFSE